ncbi:hypothetical protein C8R44DRAFT_227342 [Mycena epipterygia]|nr:hypothetical protein C8R44DRAFT_227342 [Mycena epipterygia]
MYMSCTNCHKIDPDLKLSRCGRCKEAWYCSKECQKKHWPKHKEFCRNVDGSGILKLVNNFSSNPILNMYLPHPAFRPPSPPAARAAVQGPGRHWYRAGEDP